MLFDFILMVISAVSIFTCFKYKAELDKLSESKPAKEKKPPQETTEEFSIGLSKLNNEYTGEITLDSLTGLPGREAFEDRLQQTINQSKRFEKSFAIIVMNINEFHLVNSQKGYDTGDKLLQEVAKRLQGIIRQIDTVTRYAGNVFVFLLPQLTLPETAVYVAQRILDTMVLPFNINNEDIQVNANVGVAIYPGDGVDPKTLLKNASDALVQSRVQGPNKYQFYQQEIHALGQRELALRDLFLMPNYLEKLSIQYFSQINIKTKEIISIQAVPYIDLPAFGKITMVEFSKIAANCKKTVEIGDWLFKNAAKQFHEWHQTDFKPKKLVLSVTIEQIKDIQFIQSFSQKLAEYQIQSNQIILEILGDNILSRPDFENTFALLSSKDIHVAFSVLTLGMLALQKLTQLPISYLKIDSKLVKNDAARQQNESIIHMLVALSHELNIDIVVDGIDTETQKEIFSALGCDIMQGKLFPAVRSAT